METGNRLDLTANWSTEEKHRHFVNRERLLLAVDQETGLLPIEALQTERGLMLAALSFAQEGLLSLDSGNPDLVRLTESGKRLASGSRSLRYG